MRMARTSITGNISHTTVGGSILVGNGNVHYQAAGDIVFHQVATPPAPRLRDLPVRGLPRDFPAPLGRAQEIDEAREHVEEGELVEIVGESGSGKTTLLRHLAHRVGGDAARDGVLHTYCGHQPPADLLQWLFECFVDVDAPTKATPGQLD